MVLFYFFKKKKKKKKKQRKHPPADELHPEALLQGCSSPSHSVIFDKIDGSLIRCAVDQCQGSAGPSGLDAGCWRRLCTMYRGSLKRLCSAVAEMARRLCVQNVDPAILQPFIACRLIPLSKNPGVCPIGICETLRRIIGKAILRVLGPNIRLATAWYSYVLVRSLAARVLYMPCEHCLTEILRECCL